jgi:hypothetical protein
MKSTDIPQTYREVPAGFSVGSASVFDLARAGFEQYEDYLPGPRPGEQPQSEMVVEGIQYITPDLAHGILRSSKFRVLTDRTGNVVATWDEGRWWTPKESAEFLKQIVAEMRGRSRYR